MSKVNRNESLGYFTENRYGNGRITTDFVGIGYTDVTGAFFGELLLFKPIGCDISIGNSTIEIGYH